MSMYALTVSTAEPKNIKEAMADSAWIEAMQEELHQFDRLQVWELVDKPFGKTVIRLKWLWKNEKDEDQTVKEYDCLVQKLSKQTESVSKNDTICNEKASNVYRKGREQYIKIQDLKAKLQDKNIAISELKKLIEKGKGKSVDTKFDRPSIVQQPNTQRIPKPSVLGRPTPFSNSLDRIYFQKTKSVPKANVLEDLSKPITALTLPQSATKAVSNTNVLKPGMYKIDNMTAHTRAPWLPQTVRNTNPR
nr:Gag-Pol polyprotein [Tanacetum cinerariifolium]